MLVSAVAMATEVDDRVGSLVDGRYRILEAMASGSMGAVYKAERVPVGKLVAIKFLHATYANDSEFLARFERETRVMSKLAHPNCVSVVDFGVWDGTPYLVMEYVGGRTLRRIIDGGALPAVRALAIARQIAAGLAHAHAQGITHRDVKPANIMISEEIGTGEHVRILDFGLARLRGAGGRDATQSNIVVGTPNYMAPEQTVGGGIIDARTDIYAVGVVLFEMVVGERPFQAEDTLALLGMHRAAPIPRITDRVREGTELPDGLQEVIEKAMAKSPDDRYQSAIALAEAIDGMIGRPTVPTDPKGHQIVRQVDATAVAPTLLDISSREEAATTISPARTRARSAPTIEPVRSSSRAGVFLALLVLGGGAYAAYYVQNREAKGKPGAAARGSGDLDPGSPDPAAGGGSGEAPDPSGAGSADPAAAGGGSGGKPDPSGPGSGGPGSGAGAGGGADPAAGSGGGADPAGDGSGSPGEGELEAVPSPGEATNPDPSGAGSAEDEDDDAPKTQEDAEKRPKPAPAPALAPTVNAAVKLIKEGKRDLALASLHALYKKQPKSAYIPFLLGNLYFDQRWWAVAMEQYRVAISRDAGYRGNAILIGNMIRMLLSKKTDRQAEAFLKKTIGRPAVPYLQITARSDRNPYLRKYAGALARQIR